MNAPFTPSRRDLLKGTGALIVALSLPELPAQAQDMAAPKTVAPDQVDGFLAIDEKGMVTVYAGKVDLGTGGPHCVYSNRRRRTRRSDGPCQCYPRRHCADPQTRVRPMAVFRSKSAERESGRRLRRREARFLKRRPCTLGWRRTTSSSPMVWSARNPAIAKITYANLIGGKTSRSSLIPQRL